ncbi:MAG: hypothetical protein IJI57_06280 [Flexilinea sp.]|nr:hypothetical protein [Flexilinea sp.]
MSKLKPLSVLFLIAAFGIVQYYIWGNAFITEFQSDCTDTLLWAQSMLESGSLFKPSFDYAYRLAFGGQWLFLPFLKLFGVGMTALRAGMCLFTVLFTFSLLFFFRSLGCGWAVSSTETAVMLLAACATKKTREIFYGHVIHYSLSVFYLLLAFIFLSLALNRRNSRSRVVGGVLFTMSLFMCSANGTVEILYVTIPLLAACVLEWYLSGDRKLLPLSGLIVIAGCGGFLFSKTLNTNYSDSYSVIVPFRSWAENLSLFPVRWISLFYPLSGKNLDSFSPQWTKWIFRTVIALMMLAGVFLSFSRWKNLKRREERLFIFTVWGMFAAFLFFFVFGKISDVDWRLTPLVFAAELLVLVLLNGTSDDFPERTLSGGLTLLCALLLVLNAFSNGLSVLRIPYDKKIWFAEDGLLETLKAHDLDYGYITSYWLSNSVTVLSDDTIRPRPVAIDDGHLYLNLFNSDLEWYADQPERDRWFLALTEEEFDPEMPEAREASEIYTCTQEDTRNSRTNTYLILVHDHNIMQEEFRNLLQRYK